MELPLPVSPIGLFVHRASSIIKNHERLSLTILAVVLLWGVTGKVQDMIAAHDQKLYDAAQIVRQAQSDKNAAQAQQNAALAQQYQQMAQQIQAHDAALEAQNISLLSSMKRQQANDQTLVPPALALRIESLASLPAGSIAPGPGDAFTVTAPGAVGIAQQLENIPALQGQLANTQTEKANGDKLLAQQGVVVTGLQKEVAGLKVEIADADDAHKKEIKTVKDQAGKGKRKWFVTGYIAGLATRGVIKLFGF